MYIYICVCIYIYVFINNYSAAVVDYVVFNYLLLKNVMVL